MPRPLRIALIAVLALAAVAGLGGVAVTVVARATTPEPVTVVVTDGLAGVGYRLPAGWREGAVAPVSGFTSVSTDGEGTLVMLRAGPRPGDGGLEDLADDLAELYSRVILHGDTVDVVDDRQVTVAGRRAHTRALRAEYRDVVNRPAFLRVVVVGGAGGTGVMLALAQPDDTRARADIDAIVGALTPTR